MTSQMTDLGLLDEARSFSDETVRIRRAIHAEPEIGLELPRTQEFVAETLASLGIKSRAGTSCSSLEAVVEGDKDGPTVLLRADMDALEMPEDTGLEFSSKHGSRMHACGHDAHTAMLLGAAKLLVGHRKDLAGRVVLMFQPGEEGHDGAKAMIDDGLLERYGAFDEAFAIHISSVLPSGLLACKPGTIMASADEFRAVVTGKGGHASMPHDAIDPVVAACHAVTAVQSMVTRRIPAFDPAVVTVSTIHAGTATNVIPESVALGGTVRAVSDHTRALVLDALANVLSGTAAAHGCTATMQIEGHSYPVTVNDAGYAGHTLDVARALLGPGRAVEMPTPVMGAEDWSHVLRQVRGSMAFLGASPPGVAQPAPNHSNRFVIDETAMPSGVAMYAAMALSASSGSAR
ncbi:MAG: M20 metallopeptidase family protein [Acidimicrobiales bacterium]